MKKVLRMTVFSVTALCLGISSGYAQGQPRPAASAAPTGTRVAVIDINFIFKNHMRFKQTMDGIKKEIETFEVYLREERNKVTAKTEQLKALPAGSPQYKQLEEQIITRKLVERAKGKLMKGGLNEEDAYRALQLYARKNRMSLREAAGAMLGGASPVDG